MKYEIDNAMRWYGDFDENAGLIKINKKKAKKIGHGELLDTIIHEDQHAKHPRKTEKGIRQLSKKVGLKLSRREKNKMYSKIR